VGRRISSARLPFHDRIKQAAVGEVSSMRFLPAAEDLVDGEVVLGRELGGMFLGDRFEPRPV